MFVVCTSLVDLFTVLSSYVGIVLNSHVLINLDCTEFIFFFAMELIVCFSSQTCEFYLEPCQYITFISPSSDKQVIYHIDLKQIEYIFMEIYVSNTNILGGWKK